MSRTFTTSWRHSIYRASRDISEGPTFNHPPFRILPMLRHFTNKTKKQKRRDATAAMKILLKKRCPADPENPRSHTTIRGSPMSVGFRFCFLSSGHHRLAYSVVAWDGDADEAEQKNIALAAWLGYDGHQASCYFFRRARARSVLLDWASSFQPNNSFSQPNDGLNPWATRNAIGIKWTLTLGSSVFYYELLGSLPNSQFLFLSDIFHLLIAGWCQATCVSLYTYSQMGC